MILGESIILTLTAAVVGIVVGVIGVNVLLAVTGAGFKPELTVGILLRAIGIAFLVGIIGGLYPAYRASRLPPTEALRYE
jgi:putative ABC transport system permease protein